uniref:Uncharacterized protein n=1 Tax=Chromera velia CCMP2878 TaxID=1169474 RepID=A0A0G4F6N5_9ALVE|eukprot:Cvel_15404.t1-p1 / transcript=Cvel_15404.t1 / gene=Cvel_15404 / organism=Chromera_velia_CCMP2878 / gene_product=hypothetical protein / transcript_product=hypothetical protein / location=Cvel_scaffold1137:49508-54886(-) / protein_length=218 / sequence_SO=supercontig / SO=protein_coding / is_pseudo=false
MFLRRGGRLGCLLELGGGRCDRLCCTASLAGHIGTRCTFPPTYGMHSIRSPSPFTSSGVGGVGVCRGSDGWKEAASGMSLKLSGVCGRSPRLTCLGASGSTMPPAPRSASGALDPLILPNLQSAENCRSRSVSPAALVLVRPVTFRKSCTTTWYRSFKFCCASVANPPSTIINLSKETEEGGNTWVHYDFLILSICREGEGERFPVFNPQSIAGLVVC